MKVTERVSLGKQHLDLHYLHVLYMYVMHTQTHLHKVHINGKSLD